MWVYLLGFAVLIMNFLIAILTDIYSYYPGVANALHIREMIKLRVIFGEDRHYQWLAKTPNLINFHMLIFAPIVIFFKSRKLNSFLIYLSFSIVVFMYNLGLIVYVIESIPFMYIIALFLKLKYFRLKTGSILDFLIGVFDIIILLWFLIMAWILMPVSIINENKKMYKDITHLPNWKFKLTKYAMF